MRSISIYTLIVLSCLALTLRAGEKEDILKMNEAFNRLASFSMNVEVKIFSNGTDVKPAQSFKGEARKSGNCFYSSMLGKTSLVNAEHALLIDVQQKLIVYDEVREENQKDKAALFKSGLMMVDTALTKLYKLKYLVNNENIRRIEISRPKDKIYRKIELELDAKTSLIRSITYYYIKSEENGSPYDRISISYTGLQADAKIAPETFSEKKYVSVKNTKVTATAAYKTYKIVDQRKNIIPTGNN